MAFLHGAAGNWDEVALLIGGFVVLWAAVKLAGRRPSPDPEDPLEEEAAHVDPGRESPP